MSSFEQKLENLADLAVRVGINLQQGQTLVVNAPIVAVEFVRKVAKKAYEAGAKNVHVEWHDEQLALTKYLLAPDEAFTEFPMWRAKGYEELAEGNAAFLSVVASNPELLKDVNPERIATANKTAANAMKNYSQFTRTGKVSWSIVAIPTKEWAAKVFAGLSEEESVQKLWESIFMVTRADLDNPVQAWSEHIDRLQSRLSLLNSKKYKKLHYKSSGTDLTVELPEDHLWVGGGITNAKGTYFVPNIPTEEVFTAPLKNGVNGTVSSTKPLNLRGSLVENFSFTLENGKIVDVKAEKGLETLKKLIETDEGAHFFGEVALVPYDSPISNSNIIFYSTLFDENASSHFAIGSAYPLCIEGGTSMTKEELASKGVNDSLTHVDFMIGSADLNIDAETKDGQLEPLFRNGNWAI